MEEKEYKTTTEMRGLNTLIVELQNSADKVLRGSLFHPISVQDKIMFIRELSSTRASLWEAVYREYPDLIGKNLQFTNYKISILK